MAISPTKKHEIEQRAVQKFGAGAVERARANRQQQIVAANKQFREEKAQQAAKNAKLSAEEKVARAMRSTGSTVTAQDSAPAASLAASNPVAQTTPAASAVNTSNAVTAGAPFKQPSTAKQLFEPQQDLQQAAQTRISGQQVATPNIKNAQLQDTKQSGKGWFQKGALEEGGIDGVLKAGAGTAADASIDFGAGFVGVPEKVIDFGASLLPYFTKLQYNSADALPQMLQVQQATDELVEAQKQGVSEFIARDLYDPIAVSEWFHSELPSAIYMSNVAQSGRQFTEDDYATADAMRENARQYIDNEMESASVLGDKADQLVQSGGEMAAVVALAYAGVPADITLFTTSMGSEVENALQQGATYEEAMFSGAVSAGAEVLTEKVSGFSFGGKTLDEALVRGLSRRISNRAVRTLVKLGLDIAGEGGEEILAGVISALGQKLSYLNEAEMREIFSSDDALDAFIGGALLGGTSSGMQALSQSAAGYDYATGAPSGKVEYVNALYESALAAAEENGERLNAIQRNKLYDEIIDGVDEMLGAQPTAESPQTAETEAVTQQPTETETALQEAAQPAQSETAYTPEEQAQLEALLPESAPDYVRRADVMGNLTAGDMQAQLKNGSGEDAVASIMEMLTAQPKQTDAARVGEYVDRAAIAQQLADMEQGSGADVYNAALGMLNDPVDVNSMALDEMIRQQDAEAEAKKVADEAQQQEVQELAEAINPDAAVFRAPDVVGNIDGMDIIRSELDAAEVADDVKDAAEAFNRKVVIVKSLPRNANAAWHNGTIYMAESVFDPNAKRGPLSTLLFHEITHSLRGAKSWDKFKAYALQQLEARPDIREEVETLYRPDEWEEEYVAHYVEQVLFQDQEAVNALARAQRSTAQRIWEKLKSIAKGFGKKATAEQRAVLKAERMFAKALAQTENPAVDGRAMFKLIGNKDGKDIFVSNFPPNTPKDVKAQRAIELVQNVWSKKPITIAVKNANGDTKIVSARFDPRLEERSDLSKMAFGNRKGNSSAKRITTELVDDWYYMAERAAPTWGKAETGKSENPAHDDVRYWYYLNFDFLYREDGVDKPYTMHIDIKEKADGAYFYSFGVDKTKELRPSGLLSEVTTDGGSEILSNNHYAQSPENVNPNAKFSLPDTDSQYMAAVESGDMETAQRFSPESRDIRYSLTNNQPSARGNINLREAAEQRWRKSKAASVSDWVQQNLISGQKPLENLSKDAEALADAARRTGGTLQFIAEQGLASPTGEALGQPSYIETFVEAVPQEQRESFDDYRKHLHNIDRMSLENDMELTAAVDEYNAFINEHPEYENFNDSYLKRIAREGGDGNLAERYIALRDAVENLKAEKNKPVVGHEVNGKMVPYTAEESAEIVADYEAAHPEWAGVVEAQNDWWDAFNRAWLVDTGLVSEQSYEALREKYPNYMPTYTAEKKAGSGIGRNRFTQNAIKEAKGSLSERLPYYQQYIEQIERVIKMQRRNDIAQYLVEYAAENPSVAARQGVALTKMSEDVVNALDAEGNVTEAETDILKKLKDGTYQFTAKVNGENVTLNLSEQMYNAVRYLFGNQIDWKPLRVITDNLRKLTSFSRATITGYNPLFIATNFVRDLQTYLGNNSGDMGQGALYYAKAIKELNKKGEYYKQLKALGGISEGYYSTENAYKLPAEKSTARKVLGFVPNKIADASQYVESIPRLAEYMILRDKYGNTPDGRRKAALGASDVTTNFSRTAPIASVGNALVLYFNAGMQGLDKTVRQLKAAPAKTIAKYLVMQSLAEVALALMNAHNPHYDELDDEVKDNYFLIPLGDPKNAEKFLRLPRSREYGALFGGLTARIIDGLVDGDLGGEDMGEEAREWFGSVAEGFSPPDVMGNNILNTFTRIDLFDPESPGKTWYGGDIVPHHLQKYSPNEQYDSGTSLMGRYLAKLHPNLSPEKIDDLVDSYGGIVADVLLGATSPRNIGETGWETAGNVLTNALWQPVVQRFTSDPRYSSGVVDEFYNALDEAELAAADRNKREGVPGPLQTPEEIAASALSKLSGEMSELYAAEREAYAAAGSARDKRSKSEALRGDINEIAARYEDVYNTALEQAQANWDKVETIMPLEDFYALAATIDADGNGSWKNEERENALNRASGLTAAEKAFLWSMFGGSDKSNPYD